MDDSRFNRMCDAGLTRSHARGDWRCPRIWTASTLPRAANAQRLPVQHQHRKALPLLALWHLHPSPAAVQIRSNTVSNVACLEGMRPFDFSRGAGLRWYPPYRGRLSSDKSWPPQFLEPLSSRPGLVTSVAGRECVESSVEKSVARFAHRHFRSATVVTRGRVRVSVHFAHVTQSGTSRVDADRELETVA